MASGPADDIALPAGRVRRGDARVRPLQRRHHVRRHPRAPRAGLERRHQAAAGRSHCAPEGHVSIPVIPYSEIYACIRCIHRSMV